MDRWAAEGIRERRLKEDRRRVRTKRGKRKGMGGDERGWEGMGGDGMGGDGRGMDEMGWERRRHTLLVIS